MTCKAGRYAGVKQRWRNPLGCRGPPISSSQHRRCYCLLPEKSAPESTKDLNCGVGGHPHLNFLDLYGAVSYASANKQIQRFGSAYLGKGGMLDQGEVEWLCFPRVLRLRREPGKRNEQGIQMRGLSARVGAYLAEASRRLPETSWSAVMLWELTPPMRRSKAD